MIMEYFFKETVGTKKTPNGVFWEQGYFYLNDQKRIATVTDVKFISKNKLIVAHRAAAKLYLIEVKDNMCNVLHSLILDTGDSDLHRRYYHPDTIYLHNNTIYMTDFTHKCCVVDVANNRMALNRIFDINPSGHYHGCHVDNNNVMFGEMEAGKITLSDITTKKITNLYTNINKGVKAISTHGRHVMLGVDKSLDPTCTIGARANSWFYLYELDNNKLVFLDSLKFPNSQVDGSKYYKNHYFFSLQDGNTKYGSIVILTIVDDKIKIIKNVKCKDFPHGFDIYDDQFIYSAYSDSSINSLPLSDIINI